MGSLSGRFHHWPGVTAVVLALAGCASTGATTPTAAQPLQPTIAEATIVTPTEAPAPAVTSTATSDPRPTSAPPQPIPTDPPTPENTPIPTATYYPPPAVPLSSTGPWLIFRADCHLWAINQDGTGLTRLTNEAVYTFAVQPTSAIQNGLTIAYAASGYDGCWSGYREITSSTLRILSWPGGDVKTIVYQNRAPSYLMASRLVWSPSGSKLAFVGMIDGSDTSVNTFVYDAVTERVTRITVTEADERNLRWSEDERHVIFETVTYSQGMGEPEVDGVWSARVDAGGVTQLVARTERQWIDTVEYLEWLSPAEIVVTFRQAIWGEDYNRDVRILNIETGIDTTIASEPLLGVAYSPEHSLFLMTKNAPAPNTLLIFYQNSERREVTGYAIQEVQWLSAYDAFLGQTPDGYAYLIMPGTMTEIPSPGWKVKSSHSVLVSPDRQWWAWHRGWNSYQKRAGQNSELWVGTAMSQPAVFLSFSEVVPDFRVYRGDVIWSPDSQHLLWLSHGQDLWVASPPNFEAAQVLGFHGSYDATFSDAVWVQ